MAKEKLTEYSAKRSFQATPEPATSDHPKASPSASTSDPTVAHVP